jgi:AbrB family looped-hinge helix DNA binding protein
MPIVHTLRYGQITLPKKFRETLNIQEGDILEAQLEDGKIILTPKTLIDRDRAWDRVIDTLEKVHAKTRHIPTEEAEHDAVALVQSARQQNNAAPSS